MPTKPPKFVIVIAVLALVIGSISLASMIFRTFLYFGGTELLTGPQTGGTRSSAEFTGGLAYAAPGYAIFDFLQLVLSWVVTMGYLAIGEGLLKMRPWARELAVWGSYVSLGHKALWAVYSILVLVPTWISIRKPTDRDLTLGLLADPFLAAVFPIVMLWVVTQPDVVQFWNEIPPDEPTGKVKPPAPPAAAAPKDVVPAPEPSEAIQAERPFSPPEKDGPAPPNDTHIQPA
jgi:hypothetical protein